MNMAQSVHISRKMNGRPVQINPGGGSLMSQHQQQRVASGHPSGDPEFDKMRSSMIRKIVVELRTTENMASKKLDQLSCLAKRLEGVIHSQHPTKADYYSVLKGHIFPHLQRALKTVMAQRQRRQRMSQMLQPSTSGTTIPISDVAHSASGNTRVPHEMASGGDNLMAGSVTNGHHRSFSNFPLHSTTNYTSSALSAVIMQGQVTDMIPTPGSSIQQTLPVNPQYSFGAGYLNGELTVMAQMEQQQRPFTSKNSSCLDHGHYSDSGGHSDMMGNSPSCASSEAHMIGGMGLHRSNVQVINRTVISEALINSSPYGTSPSKPLQRQYNPPTQRTPGDLTVSRSFNRTDLLPKSRTDSSLITTQTTMQSLQTQTHIEIEGLDMQDKVSHKQPLKRAHQLHPGLSKLQISGSEMAIENIKRYHFQLRLLLLLFHAKSCQIPPGSCESQHCGYGRNLVNHFMGCQIKDCSYMLCRESKMVTDHYENCINEHCPVCSKAKEMLHRSSEFAHRQNPAEPVLITHQNINQRITDREHADGTGIDLVAVETFNDQPPATKRSKLQPVFSNASKSVSVPQENPGFMLQEAHPRQLGQNKMVPEQEVNAGLDIRPPQNNVVICYGVGKIGAAQNNVIPGVLNGMHSHVQRETFLVDKVRATVVDSKEKTGSMDVMMFKTGIPKLKGISLMELFTPEQIHEHINSLRQWVGQSKATSEKSQATGYSESENVCQLCKVEKLNFEPPPIYCSPCGARIKWDGLYYIASTGMDSLYFCIPCYNASPGKTIEMGPIKLLKEDIKKRRNNVQTEEGWVQCDKCECWQHQICALFNARRNGVGEAEYTCAKCYIEELKHGLRAPLPESTVRGAKDLPRTLLSDHIEQRLFKRLREERHERANKFKASLDEVPGADGLVVRVVSSVDKKLEVRPHFFKIFKKDNYPVEFPYKSKAILLFQKIEGVEVCLFGMYVQEYGAECKCPNQRRVYLSYLDSVKYFKPDIETVSGEALRTYVYHEILIGYLDYCKQRGFTSCYLWACPPAKGEDYILYCHPEIQKTPKSDKLREWYLSMLQKAIKENVVVELTNLYDHFFVTSKECKMKVTAACLPYFDGDYWPGAAEDIINQLQLKGNEKLQKKGKVKKIITKRALKAAGHTDLSGNAPKEAMLMQKLGETIYPFKDDFILIHLQYSCSHCCILMVSGRRWVCGECKSFYICDRCYDAEQQLEDKERHPSDSTYSHKLHPVKIVGVPEDTKDRDDILENDFFDTRQAFLSLCQGNHYQYDTLRHAKHSTMMMLYHLHNPTAPAFVTTCNICDHDIETGQGWHCEDCPDFDMCAACYQKDKGANHCHKLTIHPSSSEHNAQNKEAREKRIQQIRVILELAMHASSCLVPNCQYPNCRKIKALFHHGTRCKIRVSGGCLLCTKMWSIIRLHSRSCRQSDCAVPRCRDFKSYWRTLNQLSDSRRRAAVNEMARQRAAEVSRRE